MPSNEKKKKKNQKAIRKKPKTKKPKLNFGAGFGFEKLKTELLVRGLILAKKPPETALSSPIMYAQFYKKC